MWIYHSTRALGQLLRPYWRLGLVGRIDLIPPEGPLILAANHASFLDPWLLAFAFPRPVHYLINRAWYDRSAAWTWFFRGNGTIPVVPNSSIATIDCVCDVLAREQVVGIFPEGAISHDGFVQRCHTGIARMAARSGAPVLPLGLRGDFRALPRHQRFPRPATVKIHVGEPLAFPGAPIEGNPRADELRGFYEQVIREMCRLSGQAERANIILARSRRPAQGVSSWHEFAERTR